MATTPLKTNDSIELSDAEKELLRLFRLANKKVQQLTIDCLGRWTNPAPQRPLVLILEGDE